MSDILRMDFINSLPQPLVVTLIGGSEWPVYDIEVETGLFRIDVIGLLEVKRMSDFRYFYDANGDKHEPDTFYVDYELESRISACQDHKQD